MPSQLFSRAAKSESVLTGVDPTEFDTSNPIRLFIIQAAIIIILCRILAYGMAKINQPTVIAEVIAGILLGPTVMGRIPHFTDHIFPTSSLPFLNLVATLGLVLFLFLVGLEVDLRMVRRSWKVSSAISLIGMIIPFGLGAAVSKGIYDEFIDHEAVSYNHFLLFSGVAMSITAFPVLARILTETKLLSTKVGVIVLAAGVGNDVVGWVLLALTVALVNASTGAVAVYVLLCAVGWALVLFIVIKPAFIWLARRTGSFENGPTQLMITLTLLLVLLSAWVTDIIGVHPIFGAFLVGLMVPHDGGYAVALTEKIEDLVSVIFLPLYFALSGLKTNLGDLNSGLIWGYTIAVIVIAFFSKFGGCAVTAKLCGFNLRESAAIGTLMSCKGLVELIVLNIGLSAGVLNTQTFSMFVLMAIVSTVITTPLVLWIYPERHRTSSAQGDGVDSFHSHHGHPTEKHRRDGDQDAVGRRLMVVLTGFEHLPSLMSVVQLLRPTHNYSQDESDGAVGGEKSGLRQRKTAASHVPDSSVDKDAEDGRESSSDEDAKGTSPQLPADAPYAAHARDVSSAHLSIDALRLIELTDRTSAVMRVAESEDTMRADPISNVFRTFAHLNRLPVRTSMSVVATEHFSSTVISRARSFTSDLVLLPWTLPVSNVGQDAATTGYGIASALSSPFEHIFGGGGSDAATEAAGDAQTLMRNTSQHTALARRLIQKSECDIGLLVDRQGGGEGGAAAAAALTSGSLRRCKHIVFGFMGGPDDRVALRLLHRFCVLNSELHVTVYRLQRTSEGGEEGGDGGDAAGDAGVPLPSVPPTVHHATQHGTSHAHARHAGMTVQDTFYRSQGGQSPLEAVLQDDLAIRAVEEDLAAAESAGAGSSLHTRMVLKTLSTATPLRDFLLALEAGSGSPGTAGPGAGPPALVVVGRGRKSPTLGSHREELKTLIAYGLRPTAAPAQGEAAGANANAWTPLHTPEGTTRLVNSETCKVVGEVAFAALTLLPAAQACPVLVVAAANAGSAGRGE